MHFYTTGKQYGISGKGNTRISHFDLIKLAWNKPQTNICDRSQMLRDANKNKWMHIEMS